ncbi:MAG TPA: signal recognition particle protein [Oligoflexia bacterium]|nr:signal recognition particle protein [Oligoflexia bacterium]HMP48484.1 signal recognition particle protein [Oligoflexia bacterium]
MFNSLSDKFETIFKSLRSRGSLSEKDIELALEQIKVALLEADVSLSVVKEFCSNVKKNALGMKVLKSLNPGQMVIKFVHEELVRTLGEHAPLNIRFSPPVIIVLVGLQGSGKTTSCAKLAKYLKEELKRTPILVSVDVYRPAAIEQLGILGKQLNVPVFPSNADESPKDIAVRAQQHASQAGFDTLIVDTAGRLQIDTTLMNELIDIVETIEPHEVLLVADAMTGQEAVKVAKTFDESLELDGLILTKLDGDSRGGAALSMRAVTGKPIKFIGTGEKTDALEVFQPDRMASRILGMGDVLSLIEKASKQVSIEDAKSLERKFRKDEFTLQDFYSQMQMIKKMGSISSLLQMIPGAGKLGQQMDGGVAEKEMSRVEAMILSMTPAERKSADLIDGSRKKRIARGSGTTVEEVNKLLTQFATMRKMMKSMTKMGPKALRNLGSMGGGLGQMGNMANFGQIMGGNKGSGK